MVDRIWSNQTVVCSPIQLRKPESGLFYQGHFRTAGTIDLLNILGNVVPAADDTRGRCEDSYRHEDEDMEGDIDYGGPPDQKAGPDLFENVTQF